MNPHTNQSGTQFWLDEANKLHRTDGPAKIHNNGNRLWYNHGRLHRIDGPAVELHDQDYWWVNDFYCPCWKVFQEHSKVSDEELTLLILKYGQLE